MEDSEEKMELRPSWGGTCVFGFSHPAPVRLHASVCNGCWWRTCQVWRRIRCFVEWCKRHDPGLYEHGRSACDQSAFAGSPCDDDWRCDSAMGSHTRIRIYYSLSIRWNPDAEISLQCAIATVV